MCRLRKLVALISVFVVVIFAAYGCSPDKPEFSSDGTNGTTCANVTMGNGRFAYRDGFLYMADLNGIYEYDMQTGKGVYLSREMPGFSNGLIVTENHIGYSDNGLKIMSKDGKASETVFEKNDGCLYLYIDGEEMFYLDAKQSLNQKDLAKNDFGACILEDVLTYHVTEEYIYAAIVDGEKYSAVYSKRAPIEFREIKLSIEPIVVLSEGENLFFSEASTYQITHYVNGNERKLPIHSLYYQILDGHLIYTDENTFEDNTFSVKAYNLESGDELVLCDSVFDFCILDNRYVAFWVWEEQGQHWAYYDWQTKEMKQIFPTES